ncbi:MAG: DNA-protecting protein DprA [Lewinellaceae bacterium]|nr:DNA-protecting protein DprA [Lewinellaceae bacterium]
MNDERLYQIALQFIPMVGAVTAKTLVSFCGSAEGVFRAGKRELLRIPGIGPATSVAIMESKALDQAEQELRWMEANEVRHIFYTDPDYPVRLRQNADCPVQLFFKGSDTALLNADRIVGVVGTRQPSSYGIAACEEFVEGLHTLNCVVISGLAYGIDITAHRRACALQAPNIGVLGHGLANIYPSQHRQTALRMIENGGLLSEYPFATMPDREHFPMRNRIIAGMCDALLVVETAEYGGSIITAELAHQYEREIFALPGRSNDPKSAGCNRLIKSEKARLTDSVADLAAAMRWDESGKNYGLQTLLFQEISPEQHLIVDAVRAQPEIPIDELSFKTGLSPGILASNILELEFMGILRTLPGKRYLLTG